MVLCATDLVESAHSKISDNINKLTKFNTTIDQNKEDISMTTKKQEELEGIINRITNDRIRVSGHSTPELLTRSKLVSIEAIMVNQAFFSACVQLGNIPTMKFGRLVFQLPSS